jgi:hypothetical protein
MASKREQDEMLRAGGDYVRGVETSRGGMAKVLQALTFAVIVASILFIIFYFAIRPAIVANENRRTRLEWLETALVERSGEDESIRKMLEAYRNAFGEVGGGETTASD